MKIANRRRTGFTLIELLVAAALSILIMAIMATAFQTGLGTLSTLKSLGDMAERSKTAETMLRADLEAEHFASGGGSDSPAFLRVSDLRYDLGATTIPTGGYLQLFQASGSQSEMADADGLPSSRADGTAGHRISMTVRRKGRTPDQLFSADLSLLYPTPTSNDQPNVAGQSSSDVGVGKRLVGEWAQVDWFLDGSRPGNFAGVQTWPLIRRVRSVGTTSIRLDTDPSIAGDVLSLTPPGAPAGANFLNTMATIANPQNRSAAAPIQNASSKVGDDIVITNVLSFEVRALYTPLPMMVNPDPLFGDIPGGNFDTGLGTTVAGNRIRVVGVQVKIRVYDTKNKLTRQLTVVSRL